MFSVKRSCKNKNGIKYFQVEFTFSIDFTLYAEARGMLKMSGLDIDKNTVQWIESGK